MLFLLKKLVAKLLLPPTLPLLLALAGLLALKRWPRAGRCLIALGLFGLWLFSTPVSVDWLARQLETARPPGAAELASAQAIVVLAGGKERYAPEYGGNGPNQISLVRLRYGARLARQTGLPLLLTGGAPSGGRPEATLMAEALQLDFGLQARWVESASLDTHDNARFSAALLRQAGVHRIVLVSDASHLPRARYEFERAGLSVIDGPTRYLGGNGEQRYSWLPNGNAAQTGQQIAHEWLGRLAQRLRTAADGE